MPIGKSICRNGRLPCKNMLDLPLSNLSMKVLSCQRIYNPNWFLRTINGPRYKRSHPQSGKRGWLHSEQIAGRGCGQACAIRSFKLWIMLFLAIFRARQTNNWPRGKPKISCLNSWSPLPNAGNMCWRHGHWIRLKICSLVPLGHGPRNTKSKIIICSLRKP